jgi:hypothetical protein
MLRFSIMGFLALGVGLSTFTDASLAQVVVGIGAPPGCPYGYYDYAPYACSPYGYYGPDWFNFIGAGPWFHGGAGFYGHVDNRYDPRHGYAGPTPNRGDRAFNHSRRTRRATGEGIQAMRDMLAEASTKLVRKVAVVEVSTAADTAISNQF